VLRSTFLHQSGIGAITEAELWRAGIRDWGDLRARAGELGMGRITIGRLEQEITASEVALAEHDAAWFGRRLPEREHWRLYPEFAAETGFLDIETTGLSPYEGIVTVVGVHGSAGTRSFVAGEDLEELPAYLRRFRILVTFNGSRFDLPFLEFAMPQLTAPPVHIDLRFVLYRLGLSGGLKRIEERLGIGGREGVEGIAGLDAVRLWQEFRRGNPLALQRLVRYNRADTVNLEPLLQFAVTELAKRHLPATEAIPSASSSTGPAFALGAPRA
jgi:uncharacterized protein